jgi:manganese transport protein
LALDPPEKREALRLATWDSTIALMFALTINASILILAAATFYTSRQTRWPRSTRRMRCWSRCWARRWRRSCSAWRCCACGLNSTVTATMAGQIVMEGFINLRISPGAAADHPGLAIMPAIFVILLYGSGPGVGSF